MKVIGLVPGCNGSAKNVAYPLVCAVLVETQINQTFHAFDTLVKTPACELACLTLKN